MAKHIQPKRERHIFWFLQRENLFLCTHTPIWTEINARLSNEYVTVFSIFHSLNVVGRVDCSSTSDVWKNEGYKPL